MINEEILVKIAIDGWYQQMAYTNTSIMKLTVEQLMREVAPS